MVNSWMWGILNRVIDQVRKQTVFLRIFLFCVVIYVSPIDLKTYKIITLLTTRLNVIPDFQAWGVVNPLDSTVGSTLFFCMYIIYVKYFFDVKLSGHRAVSNI